MRGRRFLYTDGLIERPGEDLGESLSRLALAVAAEPATRVDLGGLVTTLAAPSERRDDVCVLRVTADRHSRAEGGDAP